MARVEGALVHRAAPARLAHAQLARDAAEADADAQPELNALLRLYLANRGVWEAISTAGPAMSVAATRADVAAYVAAFRAFVADVVAAD